MKPIRSLSRHLSNALHCCLFASLGLFLHPIADAQTGVFTATGAMTTGRYQGTYFAGTLLSNGKVLVAGGAGNPLFTSLASAELYDPTAATFSATGSMTTPRWGYAAALLPNGKVLVTGGIGDAGTSATAELYDPTTGTFTATGSMAAVRFAHTATLLLTGKVLIAGGCSVVFGDCGDNVTSAELYDPATGTFNATGPMTTGRRVHLATLLPNGKVLVTGGATDSLVFASAELYDPASGSFSATGSMSTPRYNDTANLLPNGKVLVAGGYNGSILASAELYDPATGTFTGTGSMVTARDAHTGTRLPNGKVLVAAGGNFSGALASAEIYDPTTGTFGASGSTTTARILSLATLLPNGKVLVAGGASGDGALASAELYISIPANADDCKNNGWMSLFSPDGSPFKNQGNCIQFVNTGK